MPMLQYDKIIENKIRSENMIKIVAASSKMCTSLLLNIGPMIFIETQ